MLRKIITLLGSISLTNAALNYKYIEFTSPPVVKTFKCPDSESSTDSIVSTLLQTRTGTPDAIVDAEFEAAGKVLIGEKAGTESGKCNDYQVNLTRVGAFEYQIKYSYESYAMVPKEINYPIMVYTAKSEDDMIFRDETFPAVGEGMYGESDDSFCRLSSSNKPSSIVVVQVGKSSSGRSPLAIVPDTGGMEAINENTVDGTADWQLKYRFNGTKNQTGDAYEVKCSIVLDDGKGTTISKTKRINITEFQPAGKPTINKFTTEEIKVQQGEQFTLTCEAMSIPAGSVKIYGEPAAQGTQPLASSLGEGRSSVQSAIYKVDSADIKKHHKKYFCVAENDKTESEGKNSIVKEFKVNVFKDTHSLEAAQSTNVGAMMECDVYAWPKPKTMYFKDTVTNKKITPVPVIKFNEATAKASITYTPDKPATLECYVDGQKVRTANVTKQSALTQILKNPLYYIIAGSIVAISVVLLILLKRRGRSSAPQSSEAGTVAETEVAASSGHDLDGGQDTSGAAKTEEEQPLKPND